MARKKPSNVVIVVNDITRPTPTTSCFPGAGPPGESRRTDDQVTLLVATGIHDPHTPEQDLQVYGEEMVRRFKIVSHVSDDLDSLVHIGF